MGLGSELSYHSQMKSKKNGMCIGKGPRHRISPGEVVCSPLSSTPSSQRASHFPRLSSMLHLASTTIESNTSFVVALRNSGHMYTVHGPVRARAGLLLLALGPGPRGSGRASWPMAPGQLDLGPRGSGQGRARVGPGPAWGHQDPLLFYRSLRHSVHKSAAFLSPGPIRPGPQHLESCSGGFSAPLSPSTCHFAVAHLPSTSR